MAREEPRYCERCGARLERRRVDGRERGVCPRCGFVAYRNPLPVAAALLVEDGHVLLVRRGREPARGEWCLPMGFAELGETIEESALRELREEAGVEGQVLRLLDVTSSTSALYGDLLVVSFLVERVGGEPRPGDDAVEARWFPLDALPPLPFASNRRALERYRRGEGASR